MCNIQVNAFFAFLACGNIVMNSLRLIILSYSCLYIAWYLVNPVLISWAEEPGGLQSMGLLRVGHD